MLFYFLLSTYEGEAHDLGERLYEEYRDEIFRYQYKKLGNKDDASLATTDAFIRMLKNIDGLLTLDEDTIKRYLFGYARASFLDIIRKKNREASVEVFSVSNACTNDNGEMFDMEIADDCDVLSLIVREETQIFLSNALLKLSAEAQEIIVLKIYFGIKNVDIASQMNMNASTVSTILQRSFKKLKAELEEYINGKDN